jgi:hypothetical protein
MKLFYFPCMLVRGEPEIRLTVDHNVLLAHSQWWPILIMNAVRWCCEWNRSHCPCPALTVYGSRAQRVTDTATCAFLSGHHRQQRSTLWRKADHMVCLLTPPSLISLISYYFHITKNCSSQLWREEHSWPVSITAVCYHSDYKNHFRLDITMSSNQVSIIFFSSFSNIVDLCICRL